MPPELVGNNSVTAIVQRSLSIPLSNPSISTPPPVTRQVTGCRQVTQPRQLAGPVVIARPSLVKTHSTPLPATAVPMTETGKVMLVGHATSTSHSNTLDSPAGITVAGISPHGVPVMAT